MPKRHRITAEEVTTVIPTSVWSYAGRDLPDVDTLLTRLSSSRATNLDELAAANLPTDINALLNRLTADRAGYLNNLDNAGLLNVDKFFQQFQPRVSYSKTGATEDLYYTVLDTVADAEIYSINTWQYNDSTDPKTLKLRVTVNSEELEGSKLQTDSINYFWWKGFTSAGLVAGETEVLFAYYAPLKSSSVKVELQISTAPDAYQIIQCKVMYSKLVAT